MRTFALTAVAGAALLILSVNASDVKYSCPCSCGSTCPTDGDGDTVCKAVQTAYEGNSASYSCKSGAASCEVGVSGTCGDVTQDQLDVICEAVCSAIESDSSSCTYTSNAGTCTSESSGSSGGGSNSCFHESTIITYKGARYTMTELLNGAEPECHVPHTPSARGVVVSASCSGEEREAKQVRLTDTHLVATSKGYQLAHTLRAGDMLFGDAEGSQSCSVINITKEERSAKYFGLNCVHSEVLADGLRTSTFGDFHTLPSWYMYYAGLALGPESASRLGDAVADVYAAMTDSLL